MADIPYDVKQFNERFRSDERFAGFAKKAYAYFERMKPGMRLNLGGYDDERQEWILLTLVAYFSEFPQTRMDFEIEPKLWIRRYDSIAATNRQRRQCTFHEWKQAHV